MEKWWEPEVSTSSQGYVHQDLFKPWEGLWENLFWPVTMSTPTLVARLEGEIARQGEAVLRASFEDYPFVHHYSPLPAPGPNSNTYIQWVLNEIGAEVSLPEHAYGKDFLKVG